MGILVWLVLWAMGGFSKTTLVDIIRLCAAVPIGAAGYWVMLKLLKADLSKLFRAKDEISVNND
jgi:hypothetical protein